MRLIVAFFKRQRDTFLFLLLLLISLGFVFQANSYQRSRYFHSANIVSGGIAQMLHRVEAYVNLSEQNQLLSYENLQLRRELSQIKTQKIAELSGKTQVLFSPSEFEVFRAEILRNSVHHAKNYLIINKGTKDSIFPDMGVISSVGIVGIVDKVSERYASVQSVLNTRSRISVALKNTAHYGTLTWDAKNTQYVQLIDIPNIAPVHKGDTVVTYGHSAIFPKGIPVGTVSDYQQNPRDNSLLINVQLFTDMSSLQYTYIIRNKEQALIKDFEKTTDSLQNL